MQVCANFKKSVGEGGQGRTQKWRVDRKGGIKRAGNIETVASPYACLTKTCAGHCSLSYFIKSFL